MREYHVVDDTLLHTSKYIFKFNKSKRNKYNQTKNTLFPTSPYYKKNNHQYNKCWWRLDSKCHRCGQNRHVKTICKSHDPQEYVKIVEYKLKEELLFKTSCVIINKSYR